MTIKVAIVLPCGDDPWRVTNLSRGLVEVAKQLVGSGFDVELILPPKDRLGLQIPAIPGAVVHQLTYTHPPIVAGPGSASLTASLKVGHQLWRYLSPSPPDIVLAPLAGGVLQPALMSRNLGESLGGSIFVAWGEPTTAERIELGDIEPASASTIVDDALENTTLRLLDAIASPRVKDARGGAQCRHLELVLPGADGTRPSSRASSRQIDEIVYVGPASARHGTPEFLAAVERLGRAGALRHRLVTFLGPWREGRTGLGKAMLGRRARDWNFAFTHIDETDRQRILSHLARPGVLAISPGAAPDDDSLIADLARANYRLAVCEHHPLARKLNGLAWICSNDLSDLGVRLDQTPLALTGDLAADGWGAAFSLLAKRSERAAEVISTRAMSASLCITHRDRPAALAAAIQSCVPGPVGDLETIVVDTGSRQEILDGLQWTADKRIHLIEGPSGGQQATARNAAARHASNEILVFLDDDNIFVNDGLARLIYPFCNTDVDIVASTLSLYDQIKTGSEPAADLVFLGEAGWAGLLFNGFGDANFAIRRDAFRLVGGFQEDDGAAFDWVFLAKAQAAGLKIGTLQTPAIGYRRELGSRDAKWRKHDLEGPRNRLLKYYAGAVPASIIALTQSAFLDLGS